MSLRLRFLPTLLIGMILNGAVVVLAAQADPAEPTEADAAKSSPWFGPAKASFDASVASKYLFQGLDYSDGRTVLQPDLVVTAGSFSAVAWANYQPDLRDVNEVDLSLKVTRSFHGLTASPGYTNLHYPNRVGWDPSQEISLDLGLAAPLNPSLSIHYDFDAGDGSYSTLNLSQALGSSLSVATNVFYQNHYYGMTGFPSTELKVSASLPFHGLTLAPSLSRFVTTENGDFSGAAQVPATWLLALNVALSTP